MVKIIIKKLKAAYPYRKNFEIMEKNNDKDLVRYFQKQRFYMFMCRFEPY
jgi:hypothetical protein